MNIQVRNFSFVSKYDAVRIHGVCMIPEKPVAILQMVHGMCEHKGRFMHFMRAMAQKGYITVMHDNRGHGESVKCAEDIGYCYESMEKGFVADIHKITCQMKKEYPELPVILYGHSMGSLGVRAYLRHHDDEIDGLIVAGCPSYNDFVPLGLWGARLLKRYKGDHYRSAFFQKLVLGSFEMKFWREHNRYAWLAVNPSVAKDFAKDQLCQFHYTLNGFETVLNLEYVTYRAIGYQMKKPDLPILFLSGLDDPCYINEKKWQQAINRMSELGYQDVLGLRYDNMRHEIHNEVDKETVFEDMDVFCRRVVKNTCEIM